MACLSQGRSAARLFTPYNEEVLQFSFPAGSWFGVQVRVHISLLLLLAIAAGYSLVLTGSVLRGLALWAALAFALLARELARCISAAYLGLSIRAVYLLPVGGVMALAPRHGGVQARTTRTISTVGSLVNLLAALLLLGFGYGIDPRVRLLDQPWIGIEHIFRSAIWLQFIVGIVNLIPTTALPTRRLLGTATKRPQEANSVPERTAKQSAFGLSTAFALALIVSGAIFGLLWPVLLGLTVLLTSYLNRASRVTSAEALSATVRDVMLTEFRPLNASTTLRDALRETSHTTQELFPVLRGERLVGWTSRSALVLKLRTEGDGFLQGLMSRSFQAVATGEKIGEALRRATALGAAEFIPVVDEGAMVGMLTPVSVERAASQLRLTQTQPERDLP